MKTIVLTEADLLRVESWLKWSQVRTGRGRLLTRLLIESRPEWDSIFDIKASSRGKINGNLRCSHWYKKARFKNAWNQYLGNVSCQGFHPVLQLFVFLLLRFSYRWMRGFCDLIDHWPMCSHGRNNHSIQFAHLIRALCFFTILRSHMLSSFKETTAKQTWYWSELISSVLIISLCPKIHVHGNHAWWNKIVKPELSARRTKANLSWMHETVNFHLVIFDYFFVEE